MTSLSMFAKSVGDSGAIHVAKSIHMIEDLKLDGCNITAKGVAALAEHIERRTTSVSSKN